MFTMLSEFIRDESGATVIEYGFIAAFISIAAIVAMGAAGASVSDAYGAIAGDLTRIAGDLTSIASSPPPAPADGRL